jgi:hypothetical protein
LIGWNNVSLDFDWLLLMTSHTTPHSTEPLTTSPSLDFDWLTQLKLNFDWLLLL